MKKIIFYLIIFATIYMVKYINRMAYFSWENFSHVDIDINAEE